MRNGFPQVALLALWEGDADVVGKRADEAALQDSLGVNEPYPDSCNMCSPKRSDNSDMNDYGTRKT